MKDLNNLFKHMPDTVAITDAYGYVLDLNRNDTVKGLNKGLRLTKLVPDMFSEKVNNIRIDDAVYKCVTSPVKSQDHILGYTVIFTDITEEVRLERQNEERRKELEALTEAKKEANRKLSDYVIEVKNLSDYAEQLRIARSIHDDSGHAVTEIHTICRMCLELLDKDILAYRELINEGIKICKKAMSGSGDDDYSSLKDLLDVFVKRSSFPVNVKLCGTEPSFMKKRYEIVSRILKEAYHNTLEHSLADSMDIEAEGDNRSFLLTVRDNGSFRGPFEKGFGLMAMEDYVRASGGEIRFLTEEGKGFGVEVRWREHER
jgi:signal transduction histidine kinase